MIYWRTDTKMILPWQFFSSLLYLTDRFHVAEGVVSNCSQKKPKCGENISNTLCCTLFVLNTFWNHLWSLTRQIHGNMESICWADFIILPISLPTVQFVMHWTCFIFVILYTMLSAVLVVTLPSLFAWIQMNVH